MITDKMVETAGKAIFNKDYPNKTNELWDKKPESTRDLYREFAKAALEAAEEVRKLDITEQYLIFKSEATQEKFYNKGFFDGYEEGVKAK